jgi:hypothetical protein
MKKHKSGNANNHLKKDDQSSRPKLDIARLFIQEIQDHEHGDNPMGFPTYLSAVAKVQLTKPPR